MNELVVVRRALLSVSDKTGLIGLAKALSDMGIELISTGGSAKLIKDSGLAVTTVTSLTDFPEMMDGRVKTLHPNIHGGLLALRDNDEHLREMKKHGIAYIDLLVANLYPFEKMVSSGADASTCIENIDIGGPALIRAAAKNHRFVTTVVDIDDYDLLLGELNEQFTKTRFVFRQEMAARAFARTACYDVAVSNWFAGNSNKSAPRRKCFAGTLVKTLRYGENPHQNAALYSDGKNSSGVVSAIQHQGKALSYNNINDSDAAFALVSEFDPNIGPVCVITKHANPCGVARGDTLKNAYCAAYNCDRTSAFGGIVAFNRELDVDTAIKVSEIFTEVVIAPSATDSAKKIFAKKPNLRLLTTGTLADPNETSTSFREISGGFLVQGKDVSSLELPSMKVVTKRVPDASEMSDMVFAWKVAKHVKSNAIVYVKDGATVGIGAGQMSRVDSSHIALRKAKEMAQSLALGSVPTKGAVMASDAFFPFVDGVLGAIEAGVTSLIQPGGSLRDEEIIKAANAAGVAMVLTGIRQFRH